MKKRYASLVFCTIFLIIICSYAVKSQHSTVKLQLAGAVACWTKAYSSRDGVFKTLPSSTNWITYSEVCDSYWWDKLSVQLSLARNCSCSDFSTAYKGSCNPAVSRPHIWHVKDKYTVNVDQDAILGNCDGWSWASEHEGRRSSEVTQAFFYKIPDYLVSSVEEIIIELDMKFSGSARDEAYLYIFNDACDVSKHKHVSYQHNCPKRIIRGEGEHSLRWTIVRDVEKYFDRPDPSDQHWLSKFGKVVEYSTDWYYQQEPPWWKYNDKVDPRDNGYALLKFWITVPSGKDKRVFLFVKNVNVVVKIKSGINVSVSKGRRCKCNGRELECYDAGSTHQVFGSIWHGNSRVPYHFFNIFLVEQTGTKKELYEDSGFLTTNIGQPLYTDSHGTFTYNFIMPNVSNATIYTLEANTYLVGNVSDKFEFCVLPKQRFVPSRPIPPPINNPLALAKPFNDLTLKIGESINLGNLNDYFRDPDPGDSIQLCTAYSLAGKVDTKIQNLELTVIGKETGQDYVEVVCFSTDNTSAKNGFNVEVIGPVNNPIALVKSFNDLTLKVGESVSVGNLNDYFQDPDGDPIQLCTARTSTGAVDVEIQNLELTVIGKAVGQDHIEVECLSTDGTSATESFNVEVLEPSNNPIVLIKNFNDLTLKIGESINLGNLNDYFRDPDPGDSIQLCTARTSTGAVDVEIQNMELIVTGQVIGQDQIEVECSSTDRTFAVDSFNVEVVDPNTGIGVSGKAGKKHRLYVVKRGARRGGLCLRNWKCSPWSECGFRCICKTKGLVDIDEYEVESCEMCKEECECGYFKIRTCEDMSGCDEDYFYQLKLGGEITPTPKPPESMVCVPREEKPVVMPEMPEIEVTTPKPKKRNIWIFILLAAIIAWAIFFIVDHARNQAWRRKFKKWMKFELSRGVAIGDIIKKLETSWMRYSNKQKEIASKIIENLKKLLKRK